MCTVASPVPLGKWLKNRVVHGAATAACVPTRGNGRAPGELRWILTAVFIQFTLFLCDSSSGRVRDTVGIVVRQPNRRSIVVFRPLSAVGCCDMP